MSKVSDALCDFHIFVCFAFNGHCDNLRNHHCNPVRRPKAKAMMTKRVML